MFNAVKNLLWILHLKYMHLKYTCVKVTDLDFGARWGRLNAREKLMGETPRELLVCVSMSSEDPKDRLFARSDADRRFFGGGGIDPGE